MKSSNRQLLIIALIVFIGFVGVAIPFPIFAPMFLNPLSGGIVPDSWDQSMRGIMLGVALSVYPLGQFIGSPILGVLSDHYHRKILLSLCLLGTTIGYLLTAYSIFKGNVVLLIMSRFLTGILEGNVAIARAMATDIPNINRYRGFGIIGFATTMGYIIGPVIGGIFSDKNIFSWFNFYLPFCLAALLSLLAFFITSFYLHETGVVTKSHKRIHIFQLNVFNRIKNLSENESMLDSFVTMFLLFLSVDIYYEFFPAYLTGQWKIISSGIAIFTLTLAIAVGIGDVLLVPMMSRLRNDIKTICYFSSFLALLIITMLLCTKSQYLYSIFFLMGLAIATATTTMFIYISNISRKDSQGEAMGLAVSMRTLGDGLSCLVGGLLIAISFKLPMLLSAMFAILSITSLMRLNKLKRAHYLKHPENSNGELSV
jgi:MFS family permease